MPRNTFAKGLKRYKFETMEDEFQEAWSSPYRCWWSFLSCSKDYWWVCQQNGDTLDPELQRTYENFGDAHLHGFAAWWTEAARDNFLEQTYHGLATVGKVMKQSPFVSDFAMSAGYQVNNDGTMTQQENHFD